MTIEAAKPRSLLRRLYDWCVDAADKPHAWWIMGAISFAESSFFPVPPDVMLIPMALAHPKRAYVLAAWCTVTSVAGGLLGYAFVALL
jgi:membrane protein YqaA with SNARE-associated domain